MADAVRALRRTLDATGLPWEVRNGGRHRKLFIADRMVAILPFGEDASGHPRAMRNTKARIRRFLREHALDPA